MDEVTVGGGSGDEVTGAAADDAVGSTGETTSPVESLGEEALDAEVRRIGKDARRANLARARRLVDLLGSGAATPAGGDRDEAARLAHQIVGSAGTFGYERASIVAAEVESVLLTRAPPDRGAGVLSDQLSELIRVLESEPVW